jgi:peroxiredoxin
MKKITWFLALPIILASCSDKKGAVNVNVDLANVPAQKIILYMSDGSNPASTLDSVMYDGKGKIKLKGQVEQESCLRLIFEKDAMEGKYLVLSTAGENISISGDYNKFTELKIAGSPASADLMKFFQDVNANQKKIRAIETQMESLMNAKNSDSALKAGQDEINRINAEIKNNAISFSQKSASPVNAMMAFTTIANVPDLSAVGSEVQKAAQRFPQNDFARNTYQSYQKYMNAIAAKTGQAPATTSTGMPAKDFSQPDVNGKMVSLSSMRGKYVLIDFWASWCGPCRGENPNVVAAYNKFKNKNFTILGVSLDDNKDKWLKAVEQDGLTWTQVSDLKGWENAAAQDYGVRGIPANFLVDPNGNIVAANLRGPALEAKLQEILK